MAARKGELTEADYRSLAEFRFLLRRFLAFSQAAAEEAGLTPQQHQALLAIKGCGTGERFTVGKLAENLMLRHNSAVGLTDRLVRAGYVSRQTDAQDRRRVTLVLTEKGNDILSGLAAVHREELRQLTPALRALFAKLEH